MTQYDEVASSYSEMIQIDPVKVYVQRPTALKLLGSVKNKLILDVGCGDGTISLMLAKKGALVVGYDSSVTQTNLAKGKNFSPKIKYFLASPASFAYPKKFDAAFAVMVLLYSNSLFELQAFFDSTFALLKDGGKFVVIDLDVGKLHFGELILNRRFTPLSDDKIKVDFVVPGTTRFSSVFTRFTGQQFEACAKNAGFKKITWKKLSPNAEGKKLIPKEFWADFKKNSYWVAAVFQK